MRHILDFSVAGKFTPLAMYLFQSGDGSKEKRSIYRPLVAALVNAAPASLSVPNAAGITPFDALKRRMVPRAEATRETTTSEGTTAAAATAGASTATTSARPYDPAAAFVTLRSGGGGGGGGDRVGGRAATVALLKPSTIGLFREDLTESVDISPELRIDRTKLRQRLEALQDRYLHLLVAPGQHVFARPRVVKPAPGRDAAATAAQHADDAALFHHDSSQAPSREGEHDGGGERASGGGDADDAAAIARYRVETIDAPLEARSVDGDGAPKPFSTPALFQMTATREDEPDADAAAAAAAAAAATPSSRAHQPARFELDRFGWTAEPVDSSMVDDVREEKGAVSSPGANVAFAREMDVLQEANLIVDWACGKDGVEGKASDGLDGEMVQEQEQEQEVERAVEDRAEVVTHEFAKAVPPRPFTVGDLIDGEVLREKKGGASHIFRLSEFKYDESSLPLPFSDKLRISVNHATQSNVGSKARRLKNVHVLLHYAGMTEEEIDEAAAADVAARVAAAALGGGSAPGNGNGNGDVSPRSCGPQESFVAIICLLEAEQVRRTLLLKNDETRVLRSKISLCTVGGTWLVRSDAIPRASGGARASGGGGGGGGGGGDWQLKPSVRSDDGGGAVDHGYDTSSWAHLTVTRRVYGTHS